MNSSNFLVESANSVHDAQQVKHDHDYAERCAGIHEVTEMFLMPSHGKQLSPIRVVGRSGDVAAVAVGLGGRPGAAAMRGRAWHQSSRRQIGRELVICSLRLDRSEKDLGPNLSRSKLELLVHLAKRTKKKHYNHLARVGCEVVRLFHSLPTRTGAAHSVAEADARARAQARRDPANGRLADFVRGSSWGVHQNCKTFRIRL
eukprot:2641237-Pleurochrysis_carterae.AAC.3